jgi:hypothetical protein
VGAFEKEIEGKPTPRRASLLIRLFGLFAFLFGLPYLTQGVNWVLAIQAGQYSFLIQIQLAIIFLDFIAGAASLILGVGLFFHREWARKAWLVFLILLLLAHFLVIVLQFDAGYPAGAALYKWIGVVILVSIISWAYLSKASTKARFHTKRRLAVSVELGPEEGETRKEQ